jgi:hypothetical protein
VSKEILYGLNHILDGTAILEKLREQLQNTTGSVPAIQGSGQTALAAREAAEMFLHVQDTIGQLMDNSIDFFRNLEETHRMQDVALAKGINGAEGIS